MLKNQKGFTLIELLVVISILSVLAAIVVPKFSDAAARATTAKIAADLRTIDSAISMNQAIQGIDPANIEALVANGYLTAMPAIPTGSFLITGVAARVAIAENAAYGFAGAGSTLRGIFQANNAEFYH